MKQVFFHFPPSPAAWARQAAASPLLRSMWASVANDHVNAPTTLPQPVKSKGQVFEEVSAANPSASGMGLKLKQSMAYGKALIGFYKAGVSNVWNNQKHLTKLRKHYSVRHVDGPVSLPSFTKLTAEMASRLYLKEVEDSKDNVVQKNTINPVFKLTRAEYQLLRRTPLDFAKLPTFAVLFLIFMECTPLLCYVFPEVTPSTCILPLLYPRIQPPKYRKELFELEHKDLENAALRTAYNMPLSQVKLLCRSLLLVSKYLPDFLVPELVFRRKLHQHHQYLKVDNYYLSGRNGGGNVWNLSDGEAFVAALERNLTDALIEGVKDRDYYDRLRQELFRFIVDYETYNVGLMTLKRGSQSLVTREKGGEEE